MSTANMYRDGGATPGVVYDLLTGEAVPVETEFIKRTSSERVDDPTAIDDRDAAIFAERAALVAERPGPQSGDWVRFADGVERRISHVWEWDGAPAESVQTSDGGSWHLGSYGASFSGGLFPGVKGETLTDTGEWRQGACWVFHHNLSGAGRGIEGAIPFRVWACTEGAPR